ncbi:26 kDa periplasmic immunogenic protein [Halioglobus japonicus]|nr:26 kDa periplasmic immunogenic protein [Halioglobus japonicus]
MKKQLQARSTVFATLLILLGFTGQFANAADDVQPRILVSGEGSVDIAPDMAVLMLSVSREAPTAREALTANSAAMSKVLEAMTGLGIDKRDLQTASFDIQPRYTYPNRQSSGQAEPPKLVGYIVRNSLSVRVRDISKVGEVLDTSVTLGVNEGGSIQFTNDDPSAAITQARVKAMEAALAKARTLADAAGVDLGDILEISEQNFNPRPAPMMARGLMAADSAESVPVAAGENSYRVTVNVSLAITQ